MKLIIISFLVSGDNRWIMLSVSFKINNSYNIFSDVFNNIPIQNYFWHQLGWTEFYSVINGEYCDFFNDTVISGETFAENLSENVYPIIVHIGALPNDNKEISIKTLDDFNKSECEILLIITDSTEVDIYIKNRNHYDILIENLTNISSIEMHSKETPDGNEQIVF